MEHIALIINVSIVFFFNKRGQIGKMFEFQVPNRGGRLPALLLGAQDRRRGQHGVKIGRAEDEKFENALPSLEDFPS